MEQSFCRLLYEDKTNRDVSYYTLQQGWSNGGFTVASLIDMVVLKYLFNFAPLAHLLQLKKNNSVTMTSFRGLMLQQSSIKVQQSLFVATEQTFEVLHYKARCYKNAFKL